MNTAKKNINEKTGSNPIFPETIKDKIEFINDDRLMDISMELIRKNCKAYKELAK